MSDLLAVSDLTVRFGRRLALEPFFVRDLL